MYFRNIWLIRWQTHAKKQLKNPNKILSISDIIDFFLKQKQGRTTTGKKSFQMQINDFSRRWFPGYSVFWAFIVYRRLLPD